MTKTPTTTIEPVTIEQVRAFMAHCEAIAPATSAPDVRNYLQGQWADRTLMINGGVGVRIGVRGGVTWFTYGSPEGVSRDMAERFVQSDLVRARMGGKF